ncbi:MAG: hypothetical protein ACR2FG_07330, partial [Marmoricola sp.]
MLLPHDVAGANALDDERFRLANQAVPGLLASEPTAAPDRVFYALPSGHAILYAAWREAVDAGGAVTFADWLEEGLDCARPAGWRYDVAVRAWATQVGAERVTLVLDADDQAVRAALARVLDVPAGTLVLPREPATGDRVDPALAAALGRELEAIFPHGQLAAALDRAGVLDLAWTAGACFPDPDDLPAELVGRLETMTTEMAGVVQQLGVNLVGSLDRLCWRPGVVGFETVAGLAAGILEQVARQHASVDDGNAQLEARREDLRLLQQSNGDP